jgi:DNA-binding NarL/FixJ family response regulator
MKAPSMPTERKIQILVADDQELVRCGLKTLLAGTEIKVVAEAATGQAAVKLALENDLDLVLLDVRMPEGDGLTALGRIKVERPQLPVLFFSAFDNPANIARSVALGASGFLLKGCSCDELLSAIRTVAGGESTWNKEILYSASRALRAPQLRNRSLEVCLTEAERDVLRQIACGLTNKQIALELHLKYEKVTEHVLNVLQKSGLVDRTQAALWALRNGWL